MRDVKDVTTINQTKAFLLDTQQTYKSIDKQSALSGKNSVNFHSAMSHNRAANETNRSQEKNYGIPTLKMLNPELYKEIEKQERQMKDPVLLSVRNIKERYSYHEIRLGRVQKRTDELTKELEHKNEELLKKTKLRQMKRLEGE
jgi:hypothetical protein